MATPRPLLLPNRLAENLIEDLGEALAENSLPTGLLRRADTLQSVVDSGQDPCLNTGVPPFDLLLSGGLARGSFAEIAGPLSSGRTACAQALLARATRDRYAAWVDLTDAFDPSSAEANQADLARVLWARAPDPQIALRACERLLLSRAFALVVLDFTQIPKASTARASGVKRARVERRRRSLPPTSAWLRLQRSAAQTGCVLLLLSSEPLAGTAPALTLLARPAKPCFRQDPDWLAGAIAQLDLVRDRRRPREQSAVLSLAVDPEVPPVRVACLLVLDLPVAAALRAHPELRGAPTVVVSEPGPGATVLSLSEEAAAFGVRLGTTLSSARAMCAALRSRVTSLASERAARDALLDVALSASPRVRRAEPLSGLAAREAAVFLDASGLHHLFPRETGLATALAQRAQSAGLPACIGIASSQGLAHLAARSSALRQGPGTTSIVEAGGEDRFLAPLPVDTVHPSDRLADLLTRFGIHHLGALLALPRRALATRLCPEAVHLVHILRGEGREPSLRAPDTRRLEEAVDCEAPLDRVEACLFVFRGLLSRLLDRLALRGFACPSLSIAMRVEGGGRETRELSLAAPTLDLRVLLRRVRVALESAPPGAAIEHLSVSTEGVPPRRDQLDLFRPPSPPPAEIDALLAELESLCGLGRVGTPSVADDHRPGRFAMTPFIASGAAPAEERAAQRPQSGLRSAAKPHEVHHDQAKPLRSSNQDAFAPSPSNTHHDRAKSPRSSKQDAFAPASDTLQLTIRNLRPPLPARVRFRGGRPSAIESALGSGEILHCAGPWRTTGSWWSQHERFAFDHFDVATNAGLLLRLRYDHIGRCWQIDAVYD